MSSKQTSITGRDGYIMDQALLYAIAHIQSLPPEKQERSNMLDMCAIVRARHSFFTLNLSWSVEHHTGIIPNLWPEPDEELTNEDRAARDDFATNRRALVEMMQRVARSVEQANSVSANPSPDATPDEHLCVTQREDGVVVAEFGPRPTSGVVQYRDPNQAQLQDTLRQTVEFFRSAAAHGPRS